MHLRFGAVPAAKRHLVKLERAQGGWIVVGEILSIDRHPDADKLVICQVNVGDETLQIN